MLIWTMKIFVPNLQISFFQFARSLANVVADTVTKNPGITPRFEKKILVITAMLLAMAAPRYYEMKSVRFYRRAPATW